MLGLELLAQLVSKPMQSYLFHNNICNIYLRVALRGPDIVNGPRQHGGGIARIHGCTAAESQRDEARFHLHCSSFCFSCNIDFDLISSVAYACVLSPNDKLLKLLVKLSCGPFIYFAFYWPLCKLLFNRFCICFPDVACCSPGSNQYLMATAFPHSQAEGSRR